MCVDCEVWEFWGESCPTSSHCRDPGSTEKAIAPKAAANLHPWLSFHLLPARRLSFPNIKQKDLPPLLLISQRAVQAEVWGSLGGFKVPVEA